MIDAAKDDAADSPAWWIATVTGMERRGPDIAVLTLQPEQPLTYLPGHHISVQTPHWPRLWRTYSIANAPRPDGLLRLHVRAVPGGLVSPVLVHQVKAGDPLVLGAPAGAMIADTQSPRDVLCLAGGTGLAPLAHSVDVTWDASTSPSLQGYNVYRSTVSGGPYTKISATVSPSTLLFTDTTPVSGKQYFYIVTALSTSGAESAASVEAGVTIPVP